jgi:hypothetical protein
MTSGRFHRRGHHRWPFERPIGQSYATRGAKPIGQRTGFSLNDVTNRNNDQACQRAERDLATPLKALLFSAGESLIAFS